jgi:signal peptidase II
VYSRPTARDAARSQPAQGRSHLGRRHWRLAILALLIGSSIGCDQASKRVATEALQSSPPVSLLGDLLRLQYAENTGVFLGLGGDLPEEVRWWLFVAVIGVLLLGGLFLALRQGQMRRQALVGVALMLGGGLSNWLDRVAHGNVIDFLNVGVGSLRSGIFNFADLSVELGFVLVLISTWRSPRTRPRSEIR